MAFWTGLFSRSESEETMVKIQSDLPKQHRKDLGPKVNELAETLKYFRITLDQSSPIHGHPVVTISYKEERESPADVKAAFIDALDKYLDLRKLGLKLPVAEPFNVVISLDGGKNPATLRTDLSAINSTARINSAQLQPLVSAYIAGSQPKKPPTPAAARIAEGTKDNLQKRQPGDPRFARIHY